MIAKFFSRPKCFLEVHKKMFFILLCFLNYICSFTTIKCVSCVFTKNMFFNNFCWWPSIFRVYLQISDHNFWLAHFGLIFVKVSFHYTVLFSKKNAQKQVFDSYWYINTSTFCLRNLLQLVGVAKSSKNRFCSVSATNNQIFTRYDKM